MNIYATISSSSQYYYQCQNCRDSFICPDWQTQTEGRAACRIAVCPYCKSNHLDALNAALPLVTY